MIIKSAVSEPLLSQIRDIFNEYQSYLNIDLSFQDYEQELLLLPGEYAYPKGRLYLAFIGENPAGCIALRPLKGNRCEMKRLYVNPEFRGKNIGKMLANKIIEDARLIGYSYMLLDTLPSMTSAIKLYKSLGFYEIASYRFNPIEGAMYMKLDL